MEGLQDDKDLPERIRRALLQSTNPMSYGALARDLDVKGPGAIAKVTTALQALMQLDMAAGQPFIAALCEGKLSGGLPAPGFFQIAAQLGRYRGPASGAEAAAFVSEQRRLLGRA